jgi:hypothetical protein
MAEEAVNHQIGQAAKDLVDASPASGCPQPGREAPIMAYQIPFNTTSPVRKNTGMVGWYMCCGLGDRGLKTVTSRARGFDRGS